MMLHLHAWGRLACVMTNWVKAKSLVDYGGCVFEPVDECWCLAQFVNGLCDMLAQSLVVLVAEPGEHFCVRR